MPPKTALEKWMDDRLSAVGVVGPMAARFVCRESTSRTEPATDPGSFKHRSYQGVDAHATTWQPVERRDIMTR